MSGPRRSGSMRAGVQSLYGSAGLGSMRPNTVVIPFPDTAVSSSPSGGSGGAEQEEEEGAGYQVRLAMYDHAVFSQAQICGSTLRQIEEVMHEAGVPLGGDGAGTAQEQARLIKHVALRQPTI